MPGHCFNWNKWWIKTWFNHYKLSRFIIYLSIFLSPGCWKETECVDNLNSCSRCLVWTKTQSRYNVWKSVYFYFHKGHINLLYYIVLPWSSLQNIINKNMGYLNKKIDIVLSCCTFISLFWLTFLHCTLVVLGTYTNTLKYCWTHTLLKLQMRPSELVTAARHIVSHSALIDLASVCTYKTYVSLQNKCP